MAFVDEKYACTVLRRCPGGPLVILSEKSEIKSRRSLRGILRPREELVARRAYAGPRWVQAQTSSAGAYGQYARVPGEPLYVGLLER